MTRVRKVTQLSYTIQSETEIEKSVYTVRTLTLYTLRPIYLERMQVTFTTFCYKREGKKKKPRKEILSNCFIYFVEIPQLRLQCKQ